MSKSTKTWNIPRIFPEHSKGPRVSFSKKILPQIQKYKNTKIKYTCKGGWDGRKDEQQSWNTFQRVIAMAQNMFASLAATTSKTAPENLLFHGSILYGPLLVAEHNAILRGKQPWVWRNGSTKSIEFASFRQPPPYDTFGKVKLLSHLEVASEQVLGQK